MAQRKNTVQLSTTAIVRLQKLVDTGEYCSLDDAASHIIVSVLNSTRQYSPVLAESTQKNTASTPNQDGLTSIKPTDDNETSALDKLKSLTFD